LSFFYASGVTAVDTGILLGFQQELQEIINHHSQWSELDEDFIGVVLPCSHTMSPTTYHRLYARSSGAAESERDADSDFQSDPRSSQKVTPVDGSRRKVTWAEVAGSPVNGAVGSVAVSRSVAATGSVVCTHALGLSRSTVLSWPTRCSSMHHVVCVLLCLQCTLCFFYR